MYIYVLSCTFLFIIYYTTKSKKLSCSAKPTLIHLLSLCSSCTLAI